MAKKKTTSKQDLRDDDGLEVVAQLEQAFLAGLGALSNAQQVGSKAFDKLVDQGLSFRKETTDRTETLIDNVQDAIRDMSDEAQTRATGLLTQMRETPQMSKLQGVFDERVAEALDRLGVASKQQIDEMNAKLDSVLKSLDGKKPAAKKKAATRKSSKTSAKKVAKKASTKKKSTKKSSTKKTAAKKASRKKVSRKKA
jgi:poly(hydroxyalkanoate) granule-associated protein